MSVREWRCKTVPPAAFHRVGGNSMEGVKDVQGGTVRSSAPGLHGGRDEQRGRLPECSVCTGIRCARCWPTQSPRATAGRAPPRRPKLEPYTGIIGAILEGDLGVPQEAAPHGQAHLRAAARRARVLRASTPSSRTTSGSAAAGPRRCSCRCPMPRAMLRATSERPG